MINTSTMKNMIARIPSRFSLTRRASMNDAASLDVNGDGTISKEELANYIEKNAKLWAMLAVNLNLPEEKCREIATHVAYQLSKNIKSENINEVEKSELHREPTVKELSSFLEMIRTPKGEQEFFHRTVFQAFDQDENGTLDYEELDKFLDVFYEADSIFAGDTRLPSKFILKLKVLVEFDKNGDGNLDFLEIRDLISGGAQCLSS